MVTDWRGISNPHSFYLLHRDHRNECITRPDIYILSASFKIGLLKEKDIPQ